MGCVLALRSRRVDREFVTLRYSTGIDQTREDTGTRNVAALPNDHESAAGIDRDLWRGLASR